MKKKRASSVAVYLALFCAIGLPSIAFGQINTTWKGGSGNWSNPAHWTSGVPNGNFNALIDGGNVAASPVTLDINASIVNLTVDSDDGLTLNNGTTLTVTGGSITNNGVMKLNGGGGANGLLDLNSNVTLKGGGTLTLSAATGGGSAFIQQGVGGVTLTNQSTIEGTGIIGNGGLTLKNQAIINANTSSGQAAIVLNGSGGVTNTGLLEATNGGTLSIQNSVINTGGNITASGASSTVVLNSASITGGTLNSTGGGTMETGGSGAALNGVTISTGSTYTASNNATTHLNGTITNNGTIRLNGGSGANGLMNLDSNVTLTGGGTVTLSAATGGGSAFIQQGVGGVTLTNTNDIIQGTGIIGNGGLTLVNQPGGTLFANVSSQTLLMNGSGNITNTGTMKVASGSAMYVTNGHFTNFAGTTLTGGTYNVSGTLEIDELGNTGGEILSNAANIVLNTSASTFIDAAGLDAVSKLNTNVTTGAFSIMGGRNFTTVGNFTNNGSLTVGSGSTFAVKTGSSLTNFSSATRTLTGGIFTVGGTLKWSGANIVTNASNLTLTGGLGQILNATTNANALANFATNNSSGSFTLAANQNFTTGGNFTNNGKLTVNSGSTFALKNGSSLTNFNGSTKTLTGGAYAVGGTLEFTGANIVTNAANITLTDTASKIINQSGANGLANFASNTSGGSFGLLGGRSLSTVGNFSNAGTLSVAGGSGFTVGGTGVFTGTAGTTTDDGTITDSGGFNLTGGKLFGNGTVAGAVHNLSGSITPGDSSTITGILTVKGAYTQGSNGILDVSIGGTTASTQFDQLNPTTAALNGTLNVGLIKGFVPTIGQKFKIMNFTSEAGTFAHCTCAINSSEHFAITYQGKDVLLTVVAGGGGTFGSPKTRFITAWSNPNLIGNAHPEGGIFRNSVGLRDATRGARTQTMIGNSMGAPRLKSGASGLRNRSVVGGLSWGISEPLSKPTPGFAVY